jgi:hypothetical protein
VKSTFADLVNEAEKEGELEGALALLTDLTAFIVVRKLGGKALVEWLMDTIHSARFQAEKVLLKHGMKPPIIVVEKADLCACCSERENCDQAEEGEPRPPTVVN